MSPSTDQRAARISATMKGVPKSPQHRAKLAAVLRRRYRCTACGMEASVGGIGHHQKHSGHTGKVRLP